MITSTQITQQIMNRVNFQHKVADRVRSIMNDPEPLELEHYDISEDCQNIEFMFNDDEFQFVISSLLVFTPDVYFVNVAGEMDQKEVHLTAQDLFNDTTKESFLSIVRHILKSRPHILEAYDEEGKAIHYTYLQKLAS